MLRMRTNDLEAGVREQAGAPGDVEYNVANGWFKGLIAYAFRAVNRFYTKSIIGICLMTWFTAAIKLTHQVVYITFFLGFAIIFLWAVIELVFQKVSSSKSLAQDYKLSRFPIKSCSGRKLQDRVYQLFPDPNLKEAAPSADVEIVLFHGLHMPDSDPEQLFWKTWKMRQDSDKVWPEVLLPNALQKDGKQISPRVLSVKYESRADLGDLGPDAGDEKLMVESLVEELIHPDDGPIGQKEGVPVILIGHDLGGLLIKSFVIEVEELADSILSDQHPMLRFMRVVNNQTARINSDFQTYRHGKAKFKASRFTSNAIHALYKTPVTVNGNEKSEQIVKEASARADNDIFYSVSANHFDVCRPKDENDLAFKILVREIREACSNSREVNFHQDPAYQRWLDALQRKSSPKPPA
ncbi:hypothetical protein R1flu_024713 [Riccia fluitans]|uniref:AB hydrolase-1 domain-containing protein n=1 Tax=Riccia fluitans TaxID=41844 RepID=A0ABD1XYP7_9MARC